MPHRFVIQGWDGKLTTYDRLEAIPEDFQHVVEFLPDIPEPPHTEMQHADVAAWNGELQSLMRKERACRQRHASATRT
jgi:hypothetical protein